ncbi:hypothetical protein [Moorena sp. SIO1G6]|nr:hypothetical protein [Moorena sp. SIO1G6]
MILAILARLAWLSSRAIAFVQGARHDLLSCKMAEQYLVLVTWV